MLHCVPFPDAGAPAMIILGAGEDPAAASIATPFFLECAADREAGEEATEPRLLLLLGEKAGEGRADTAVLSGDAEVFVPGTTPNQPRVVPAGGTKAEAAAEAVEAGIGVAPPAPPAEETKATVRTHRRFISTRTMLAHDVVRTRDDIIASVWVHAGFYLGLFTVL